MAQATKSRTRGASSKTTKRKAAKARKPSVKTRKPSAPKARPSGNGAASHNGAGHEVVQAAKKAKTPLIASGAAVAGAAGGMALGVRRTRKSKVLRRPLVKLDSHHVAKAAKSVGRLGVEVGELASELRRNRELTNGAERRSPIEVVLESLTHRSKTA